MEGGPAPTQHARRWHWIKHEHRTPDLGRVPSTSTEQPRMAAAQAQAKHARSGWGDQDHRGTPDHGTKPGTSTARPTKAVGLAAALHAQPKQRAQHSTFDHCGRPSTRTARQMMAADQATAQHARPWRGPSISRARQAISAGQALALSVAVKSNQHNRKQTQSDRPLPNTLDTQKCRHSGSQDNDKPTEPAKHGAGNNKTHHARNEPSTGEPTQNRRNTKQAFWKMAHNDETQLAKHMGATRGNNVRLRRQKTNTTRPAQPAHKPKNPTPH